MIVADEASRNSWMDAVPLAAVDKREFALA
jgi:hypothetical protein